MQLKTIEVDGKTYAEVQDGKPIYVKDGEDTPFDAPGTVATISRLNGEAKGHREAKEASETKLKAFEGIEDPKVALEALNTVSNIDAKKLIDAGEVDKVKGEITKVFEGQLVDITKRFEGQLIEKDQEIGGLQSTLHQEKIGGSFARSKYISEKVAVPSDLIEAQFGGNFSLEDGKIIAKDANGNAIYSKANPGELAAFDEALENLINSYQHKDSILKGTGNSGGGSEHSNSGGSQGSKTMTRAAFDALDAPGRATKMKEGFAVTD